MEKYALKTTFPYDPVNRIQKLFYEYDFDDIPTIYNKNKLLKAKTKLIKYWKYCMEHVENALTPQIDLLDKQFKNLTEELDELEIKLKPKNKKNKTQLKHILNNIATVIKMRNDARRHNQSVSLEREMVHTMCKTLGLKIDCMVGQIGRIRKNYKKCNHCEKIAMINICDCKLKHKLCSECIDDKTECPVCKEDFGLQHCDICMLNKKEIEKTGCKNNHQTCKDCLVKIKEKNNKCPFCREDLEGRTHTLITYNEDGPILAEVRTYNEDEWSSIEAQNPNIINLDLNEAINPRNRRPTVLPTEPEIQVERPGEVNTRESNISPFVTNIQNSEEYQQMFHNYRSTSHENPFIRYMRERGEIQREIGRERERERGGREIPTDTESIYSREQAVELNDYNEYQNWMETNGVREHIPELSRAGEDEFGFDDDEDDPGRRLLIERSREYINFVDNQDDDYDGEYIIFDELPNDAEAREIAMKEEAREIAMKEDEYFRLRYNTDTEINSPSSSPSRTYSDWFDS
jgi:hypothetical protein